MKLYRYIHKKREVVFYTHSPKIGLPSVSRYTLGVHIQRISPYFQGSTGFRWCGNLVEVSLT